MVEHWIVAPAVTGSTPVGHPSTFLRGTTAVAPGHAIAALKPFWSGDAVKGFKYKDPKGDNGTVSGAKISLKSGKFQIKVKISGKLGTINLVPPNPGADGCATLTFNGGDSYSINFVSGTATNKGATLFKMSKPIFCCASALP